MKGPYTAMRMPSTTYSRISEMAIVCQPHAWPQPLIICINFSEHLFILQDRLESFAVSICFFSHVVSHCFTRDIEGPYAAMRMPSTTCSRISEMAIVCQPHAWSQPLIICINFSEHLFILQDRLESFAVSICFFSHVVSHCFTRDIEGPYSAMRMPSTTYSRISEMAIVRQPHAWPYPLICCINFSEHLLILRDILESFAVYQHI